MSERQSAMNPPRGVEAGRRSDISSPFDWLKKLKNGSASGDQELAHGQIVIVAARWVLVGAGLGLAMWNPVGIGPLRLQVLVLLLIAVGNFFLHAQLLRRRLALEPIAYAASAADLAVITILIASQDGFTSDLFVFYFPAILALAVAFRSSITAIYVGATMLFYGAISFGTLGSETHSSDAQTVVVRLVMICAVAVCGALYQQLESDRRKRSGPGRPLSESGA